MCGIFGAFSTINSLSKEQVSRSASVMAHRGPDDHGVWLNKRGDLALAHRRLSIVDLSPDGHQPMLSSSGRYVITFNGEIYNFQEIKEELEAKGYNFRSRSDTEVILYAIEEWGIEHALKRFVGMYAFAIWDEHTESLMLARDRMGEKPLYYGWVGGHFLFSSDLGPINNFVPGKLTISRPALTQLIRHGYIPAPHSIYQEMYKLPPATFLVLSRDKLKSRPENYSPHPGRKGVSPAVYWSAKEIAEYGALHRFVGDERSAVAHLEGMLCSAVKGQLMGDVPVGAFLSGGIDSSTICAIMQRVSSRPIKTFSVGFHERSFDESKYAKAVARHLGTDHSEMFLTPQELLDVVPNLPQIYSEPFADSSQIPTFLVSKLARTKVTVSLSGDGGDELFGGYTRYVWGDRLKSACLLPVSIRRALSASLKSVSPGQWNTIFSLFNGILPPSFRTKSPGWKVHRLAELLESGDRDDLYTRMFSVMPTPATLLLSGEEPDCIHYDRDAWPDLPDFYRRMMWLDQVSYLPDDILVKVDRAAMASSLESRVPLLDHRIVEFVATLPQDYLVDNSSNKKPLKSLLYKYVPRDLVDRPKQGFGVPIEQWLRGPLKDWAEDLLSEHKLSQQGFFNAKEVRKRFVQHLKGEKSWEYLLWNILTFQAWLDSN